MNEREHIFTAEADGDTVYMALAAMLEGKGMLWTSVVISDLVRHCERAFGWNPVDMHTAMAIELSKPREFPNLRIVREQNEEGSNV